MTTISADELRALIRAQIGAEWPDQVDVVRNRIPVFKDRRPEIYGLDGA